MILTEKINQLKNKWINWYWLFIVIVPIHGIVVAKMISSTKLDFLLPIHTVYFIIIAFFNFMMCISYKDSLSRNKLSKDELLLKDKSLGKIGHYFRCPIFTVNFVVILVWLYLSICFIFGEFPDANLYWYIFSYVLYISIFYCIPICFLVFNYFYLIKLIL